MPAPRDRALLVRAATLYYVDGKSQAEVAAEIGVSRSNVSRVLADAREQGIVDIRINDPFGRATELESKLVKRFGLAECRVAPSGESYDSLARTGDLGAKWLVDNLPAHGSIALSWGSSVQAVVDAVHLNPTHTSLDVLPLVGGLSIVDAARDGNVLVRSLAMKLGARHQRLHAPAIVESRATRDAFLAEPSISGVLEAAGSADVALVGIGSVGHVTSSTLIDSMGLTPEQLQSFYDSDAVGDCCTRYFDSEGRPAGSVADDHVISVDLDTLHDIPVVAGIAVGAQKVAGVHGALKGGLLDVFITDSALAQALLEFDSGQSAESLAS